MTVLTEQDAVVFSQVGKIARVGDKFTNESRSGVVHNIIVPPCSHESIMETRVNPRWRMNVAHHGFKYSRVWPGNDGV